MPRQQKRHAEIYPQYLNWPEELNITKNSKLTGTIDARDFKTMRDNMLIFYLDLRSKLPEMHTELKELKTAFLILSGEYTPIKKTLYLSAGKLVLQR